MELCATDAVQSPLVTAQMTLCSAIKAEVKKEGVTFGVISGCVPNKPLRMVSPVFLEVAEHLPAHGK